MAMPCRLLLMLIAGVACSSVRADTILVDDFTTNLEFRSLAGGAIGTGVFTGSGSHYEADPHKIVMEFLGSTETTSTAEWKDQAGGILIGGTSATRRGFMSASGSGGATTEFTIADGFADVNTGSGKLTTLTLSYEADPGAKIDMSDRAYFVINFDFLDASAINNLRVSLSVTDSVNTMASFNYNQQISEAKPNSFALSSIPNWNSIIKSQVTRLDVSISADVAGTDFSIRSFSLAPVPEPASATVCGILSGLLAFRLWKKRSRILKSRSPAVV